MASNALTSTQLVAYLIAWVQSVLSVVGSLYFSEILKYPPCVLCWYQRIAIYPLAVLLPIAIVREDKKFGWYGLALSLPGLCIAVYHNLLYSEILPGSLSPCVQGVSCTTKYVEYFGFVTIPFLALIALLVIVSCFIVALRSGASKVDQL